MGPITEKIEQLTEQLSKYPLPEETIKLYNDILDYFEIKVSEQELPFEDKETKKLWQLFEEQRFEISGKRYNNRTRKIAIKKVMELAKNDEKQLKHLLEWVITLGYADITPQILDYLQVKKPEGTLFKDSKYANYTEFIWFFHKKEYYDKINFRHYYERILSWSESKQIRRRHWGYTALMIIEKDLMQNKLVVISSEERKKETIQDWKLQKIWQKLLSEIPDNDFRILLAKAEPIKIFRLFLYLRLQPDLHAEIENNITQYINILYKNNIRSFIYLIKK